MFGILFFFNESIWSFIFSNEAWAGLFLMYVLAAAVLLIQQGPRRDGT